MATRANSSTSDERKTLGNEAKGGSNEFRITKSDRWSAQRHR